MRTRFLTTDEVFALRNQLNPDNQPTKMSLLLFRNQALIGIMLDAGMRIGEALSLRISDIYSGIGPCQYLHLRDADCKGFRGRDVPVNFELQNSLMNWYGALCTALTAAPIPNGYAFPVINSGQVANTSHKLSRRTFQHWLRKFSLVAIGRPICPHMLRHTFATRLVGKCSIRVIQELLGHTCLASTQRYTHVSALDLRTAVEMISKPQSPSADVPNQMLMPLF